MRENRNKTILCVPLAEGETWDSPDFLPYFSDEDWYDNDGGPLWVVRETGNKKYWTDVDHTIFSPIGREIMFFPGVDIEGLKALIAENPGEFAHAEEVLYLDRGSIIDVT